MPAITITTVHIPMRDGVRLHTRLYLPAGGPFPALLRRTPYPWEWMGVEEFNAPNERIAAQGYGLAVQYVRGRFESEGKFEPFRDDVNDGFDTIDWLSQQSWCTGSVGMYGQSYESSVQTAAVVSGHPALKSIVPQAFGDSYVDGFPYYSPGVFSLGAALGWAAQVAGEAEAAQAAQEPSELEVAGDEGEIQAGNEIYQMYAAATKIGWHEGLLEMTKAFHDQLAPILAARPGRELDMMTEYAPWWRDWVDASSAAEPYWSEIATAARPDLAIPALHISGWLDQFVQGTIDRFTRWSSRGSTPEVRAAQRLIVGPWAHGLSGQQWDGHVQASPEADLFFHEDIEAFHRQWLYGDASATATPPIRLFVMGDNEWRDEWEWPLARTAWTPYYLRSGGNANSSRGDGTLSTARPDNGPADSFDFDPADPVPAIGGAVIPGLVLPGPGQFDQRKVEERRDVLVYSCAANDVEIEATGPVSVDLWVRTSAPDTDFTAKLVDVFPSGEAVFVCQGISRPTMTLGGAALDPDKTYHVVIDLSPTSYVFRAGHSIRLEISSSCFPIWDVNPNTGKHYDTDQTGQTTVARQQIFHDASRPSHLTLPVVPR